jgi:hypothetical protein
MSYSLVIAAKGIDCYIVNRGTGRQLIDLELRWDGETQVGAET